MALSLGELAGTREGVIRTVPVSLGGVITPWLPPETQMESRLQTLGSIAFQEPKAAEVLAPAENLSEL